MFDDINRVGPTFMAVHMKPVCNTWQVPEKEFNLRISEFTKEDYKIPSGCSDKYMVIEITILQGRSDESKKMF